jgi:hypothetical protein
MSVYRSPSVPSPSRPVQLCLTRCRLCNGTGQAPSGHADDGPAECCPDCWGTGQRLVCRDPLADAAADVRLCAAELLDYPGTGYLADILLDVASRLDRVTEPPAAA